MSEKTTMQIEKQIAKDILSRSIAFSLIIN